MESKVYNIKGEEAGTITLPKRVFGAKWRADLVHQVVEGMRSNSRAGTADTKGRGEVRGGGKKPWKQKGTGRSRQGSIRSPIWVGGGVSHGPKAEKNYKKVIPSKMKAQALFSVLSKKWEDKEIIFVDSLALPEIKTKAALEVIRNLAKVCKWSSVTNSTKPKVLLAISSSDNKIKKSFRNLPQAEITLLKNINPMEILNYKYLLIENPTASLSFLEARGI
jgi:large subunit ribosomal protein L4